MFERKSKHRALLITDDHRLREVNLEVESGFLTEHRSSRSWGLMPKAVVRQRDSRAPWVILYERVWVPYLPEAGRWAPYEEGAVNRLARERITSTFTELPKAALAEKAANFMRLTIAGLTLTVAVMAMVVLITSGTVRIPGL